MLAEHRYFTLPGDTGLHADITVIPTGELKVNILENSDQLKGEFEELHFYSNGKRTELVCKDQLMPDSVRWHIDLSNDDAEELAKLIEVAVDEYETLMRDL